MGENLYCNRARDRLPGAFVARQVLKKCWATYMAWRGSARRHGLTNRACCAAIPAGGDGECFVVVADDRAVGHALRLHRGLIGLEEVEEPLQFRGAEENLRPTLCHEQPTVLARHEEYRGAAAVAYHVFFHVASFCSLWSPKSSPENKVGCHSSPPGIFRW